MKDPITLVLAAVTAVGAGVATAYVAPASQAKHTSAEVSRAEIETLAQQVATAQTTLDALSLEIEASRVSLGNAPARTSVGGVDTAVARWMEENLEQRLQAAQAFDADGASQKRARAARLVEDLILGEPTWEEQQRLWKELNEQGLLDLFVLEMEKQAAIDSSDPDLCNMLGETYLQKSFAMGVGPASIEWGEKADKAFDQALEVDDEHWEARFNKAVSLSNWPAFLGKSGEAIRQFEILVAQQETGTSPGGAYDQTYYFLGNMYQQIGESEKARVIWARGKALFPDSIPLIEQLTEQD